MTHTLRFQRLANLDCLQTERLANRPTIVMLHGYGADFQDLAGLCHILDQRGLYNWIFPNGIQEVPLGPHMVGRAWFPVRIMDLEQQVLQGKAEVYSHIIPPGLDESSQMIKSLIEELDQPLDQIILGGFSQGAMVSCHTTLNLNQNPLALLQLSSTLVAEKKWQSLVSHHSGLKVFQSHGRLDPILPYQAAERLSLLFKEAGIDLTYVGFHGYHEIPPPVIESLKTFLESCKESKTS